MKIETIVLNNGKMRTATVSIKKIVYLLMIDWRS